MLSELSGWCAPNATAACADEPAPRSSDSSTTRKSDNENEASDDEAMSVDKCMCEYCVEPGKTRDLGGAEK